MEYKGVLIVVKNIQKSIKFYDDLFGATPVCDNGGNVVLSCGIVLQEKSYWEKFLNREITGGGNASELYFEEPDIENFIKKLETLYPETEYVNKLMTHTWGQRVVRFYDLDGNLIEVGTPM